MAFGNQKSSNKAPIPATPQSRSTFDPYEATAAADGQYGGVYPLVGLYPLLYVDVLKIHDGFKGMSFIAEFEILQSNVPERPAGTRMNIALNYKWIVTPGIVKSFIAAVANEPIQNLEADDIRKACSAENPAHGRLVRLEAARPASPEAKYLVYNWTVIPDSIQETAETLRKEAGFI